MKRILINDGMHASGIKKLEAAGYQVDTTNIPQDELPARLPEYDVVLVRSATKVREALIDQCPNLKIIGRGGVGLDNIDVDYARSKGIQVMNTPAASSESVAELVFGHFFGLSRSLYQSNRQMPVRGESEFKALKKVYSKQGGQLRGKTVGIVGFGGIGKQVARIALGMGMKVLPVDLRKKTADITVDIGHDPAQQVTVTLNIVPMEQALRESDFLTVHVPSTEKPVIGAAEMEQMKPTAYIVNTARGGTIDEDALIAALDQNKLAGAALDVFVGEPKPRADLLQHAKIASTPHIGGSTPEAQENIGLELADKIIAFFGE